MGDTAVGTVDTGTDMVMDTAMDTVVMVIEAMDMATITARGLLMLRLSLLLLLSLDLDMARGLLRLPLDTTDTVDTDIMDITDTMAMDMDMARGQLRPPLDTTDIMDITDTTDT